jgi:hypothetical protein
MSQRAQFARTNSDLFQITIYQPLHMQPVALPPPLLREVHRYIVDSPLHVTQHLCRVGGSVGAKS